MAIRKVISRSILDTTGVDILLDTAAPVYHSVDASLNLDFVNTKTLDPRINFTRGSSATFYDGTSALAEQNLLPYSQTITGSSGQAMTPTNNASTAPDGTNTAVSVTVNSANDRHYFCTSRTEELSPVAGTTFTGSAYVKKNTADFVHVMLSDNAVGGGARYGFTVNLTTGSIAGFSASVGVRDTSATVRSIASGWFRVTLTMTSTANSPGSGANLNFSPMPTDGTGYGNTDSYPVWTGNGTTSAFIWGWQLEKRSAATAYTTTNGGAINTFIPVLKTTGPNEPRFDVDPLTKESKGLLVEEQRTNVFTYSNLGDNTVISSQYSLGSNSRDFGAVVGPDGKLSGRRLCSLSAGNSYFSRNQNISIASTGTYVFSIWARLVSGPAPTNLSGYFSTYAQGVTMNAAPTTSQWTRFFGTVTFATTGTTNFTLPFYDAPNGTIVDYFGPQLELGTFPTSYIPTEASSVTRAPDVAEISGTNFANFFNNQAGTAYFEGSIFAVHPSNLQGGFAFTRDTGNDNVLDLRVQQSGYGNLHVTYGYGATQAQIQTPGGTAQAVNTTAKFVIAYANNDIAFYKNGVSLGTDNAALIPQNLTKLEIGKADNSVNKVLNGYVRRFSYYPVRLTNAEIVNLTTS